MSEKKTKTNASSASSSDVKKKPSKFHTKNKKHQQHSSSRSNKHFMITGQMSGTGFRRRIQTVNDEDVDQEELEMMQQEENLKRMKYGKRSLVDNSFRFKSDEDDEEQSPEAEERKNQAKLQHELNRMEKETMMMISNSITLTQSFSSSGTSRGLLEWEEEKLESSTDAIMSNLFFLDQSRLATLLNDPSIPVERRLNLIDIQPFPSNSSPVENIETENVTSFVPFSQYLKSKTTQQEQVEDSSSESDDDIEPMQEEPKVTEEIPPVETTATQKPKATEQDDSMDILDEIMESEAKHTTFTLPKPKAEVVKIDLKSDDILDDLLSISSQVPSSNLSTLHQSITPMVSSTTTQQVKQTPPTSTIPPQQTPPEKPKTQENTGDLDDWLDDLIN